MTPEDFELGSGRVTYWSLDWLAGDRALAEQTEALQEDLAQVGYGDAVLLDIGWYPAGDPAGSFRVFVIQDKRWDTPLFDERCRDLRELRRVVAEAARRARAEAFGP